MQWFRLWHEALDDPKVQTLDPVLFRHWVNVLCIASSETLRGTLPVTDTLAFRLRVSLDDAAAIVAALVEAGLLDVRDDGRLEPHNWTIRQPASDDIAARVAKHRSTKQAGNVTRNVTRNTRATSAVTPPESESETETKRAAHAPRARASARVIAAITAACYPLLARDATLTPAAFHEVETCAHDLIAAHGGIDGLPELIAVARAAQQRHPTWHELTLTPTFLAKHWATLSTGDVPRSRAARRADDDDDPETRRAKYRPGGKYAHLVQPDDDDDIPERTPA